MSIIMFMVVFPFVAAAICLLAPEKMTSRVVGGSCALIALGSIAFAAKFLGGPTVAYHLNAHWVSGLLLIVDLALCGYVLWRAVKASRRAIAVLAIAQAVLVCYLEFAVAGNIAVSAPFVVDTLSVIMMLIIGIIGSGICVYAIGYMRDFAAEQAERATEGKEAAPDRRRVFFAVMLAFLGAMAGIVTMNDLSWMLSMWEFTTVCSFFLIGYTQTREADDSAFRQIWMNLLGGIAFTLALIWMGSHMGVMELTSFIRLGSIMPTFALLPAALLAFSGMTKAAQMPFQSWLLGAMVAPTPTSALLHSSTMVKAGVFLLIKLSPLMGPWIAPSNMINPVGVGTMLVGGVTFMLCSFIAISQTNAKRVLAYSTIANLGLITACAGIGSAEAVWAAIFLLVFHAAAKSLLFLCVGSAEHRIGSRDIESMDSLVARCPEIACLMSLGICAMFIAPFGMLISKWAALGAFINSGVLLLVIMLGFGSAATFFFWAKWLGKILAAMRPGIEELPASSTTERIGMSVMAAITVACAIMLPALSSDIVTPYVLSMANGTLGAVTPSDLAVMSVAVIAMVGIPAIFVLRAHSLCSGARHQTYLGGVGNGNGAFAGSLGGEVEVGMRNWYMGGIFDEKRLGTIGCIVCVICVAVAITCALVLAVSFGPYLGSVM